jgi:aminopeptidase N
MNGATSAISSRVFFKSLCLSLATHSLATLTLAQAPPTHHYAPDRAYHTLKVTTFYNVDDLHQRATATVVDTFKMLRDGTTEVIFNTSAEKVTSVEVDGKPAKFEFSGVIWIQMPPSPAGSVHKLKTTIEGTFFHWFKPNHEEPSHVGFYTEGLSGSPVGWAYPNDFSKTELHITVPKAWSVFSNGILIADKPVATGRHTLVWKMDQPHANYLNSIVAGPFDVRYVSWRGVPLIFSCPKGLSDRLESTFIHTKDILDYFSTTLGVKYPWAKYGQNLTYDHPYAEENVSATMYPVYWGNGPFLTNDRDGMHPTEDVIAHETAHHWFGDYVTCKNWGDTWLNEGFATFMEMMYTLHSRGRLESMRQLERYSQRYFQDSKHDFRPIATDFYSDSTGMGGWTTYNKGAGVLFTLRAQLGDKAFFRGIRRYLAHRGPGNVETNDFIEDMTDASGIDLHAWFAQWVFKPGHPIIDWSWSYDAAKSVVNLHVRQTQDTSLGTPIYDIPTLADVVTTSGVSRAKIHLNAADQTLDIPVNSVPKTVVLDPEHDFVRQIIREPWSKEELPYVFLNAVNPIDQEFAMNGLLDGNPSEETVQMVAKKLLKDNGMYPALPDTSKLASLGRASLHDFWITELKSPNYSRRANATTGLAGIAHNAEDIDRLRQMLGDDQPYEVVAAALRGLAKIDFALVRKVAQDFAHTSGNQELRRSALDVLVAAKAPGWQDAIFTTAAEGNRTYIRAIGVEELANIPVSDPRLVPAVQSALHAGETPVISAAIQMARSRTLRDLIPDLRDLKARGIEVTLVDDAILHLSLIERH